MRRAAVWRAALVAAVAAGLAAPTAVAAQEPDPAVAPVTVLSADGRSATDGQRTLAVSQARGLSTQGQAITVSGSGYREDKGIYVALCAIPPVDHVPTPCGGGVDTEGAAGASQWISSNPPSYGVGLARPYGPGGSFTTSFTVRPEISPTVDCRYVRCAVVTRSDHTRTSDRSQDIFVPVTFADPAVPTTTEPPTTVPPATLPPTTVPPTVPPPATTVSPEGTAVTDGVRTLSASTVADLDPAGAEIAVEGRGYSPAGGIYVALCAVGADGAPPGPCSSGSPEVSVWVSAQGGLATPYGDGGTFAVRLRLPAVIDGTTDCRVVACAVTTRPDEAGSLDRSQELALPVRFAAETPTTTTTAAPTTTTGTVARGEDDTAGAGAPDDEGGGSGGSALPWIVAAVVVAAAGAGGAVALRRRRGPGPDRVVAS